MMAYRSIPFTFVVLFSIIIYHAISWLVYLFVLKLYQWTGAQFQDPEHRGILY